MAPELFVDRLRSVRVVLLQLESKYPTESLDYDFTQGDESDVQLMRGANGRFPRGWIYKEEEGEEATRVQDGDDCGVGNRLRVQEMLVVNEDVKKPSE